VNFEEAAEAFRRRFPAGGLEWCDFRPHFEGLAVNAWCAMFPRSGEAATREAARSLLGEIATWLQANAEGFGAGDLVQLILGFPESVKRAARQIYKCWLLAAGLRDLQRIDFESVGGWSHEMELWPSGVEWLSSEGATAPDGPHD
jgi:hypothetical protein